MALWFKQERKKGLIGSFAHDADKIIRKEAKEFGKIITGRKR